MRLCLFIQAYIHPNQFNQLDLAKFTKNKLSALVLNIHITLVG
jgi:hypothetical protein